MSRSMWMIVTSLLVGICAADTHSATGVGENMASTGRWARGPCRAGVVVNNVAYFADGAYLQIYDFNEPSSPVQLGRILVPGPIQGIAVQGDYAYLADWDDGLRVIDVSDPLNPIETGFLDTPGDALGITVVGELAYVADGYGGGLRVIDVSNPDAPFEIGYYDTTNEACNVKISGGLAYLADSYAGLRIIDVSEPMAPVEIGFYETDDITYDVVVDGSYAYVADRFNSLIVLDVSNPAAPLQVGTLDTGYLVAVQFNDGYVYTSGQVFLGIVDVADPTNPSLVGHHDPAGLLNGTIALDGGRAYVSDVRTGFRAVDVTDPTAPIEVGHVEGVSTTYAVDVEGDYAYVACYTAGLRVVDITDPSTPEEVGSCRGSFVAEDVNVFGDYAYVASGYAGLRVIDVSDPTAPHVVGAEDLPISADAIAVSGDYAYLTGYQSSATEELFVLDISNPFNPTRMDSLDLAGTQPRNITVAGGYVYVAAWSEGLRIVDVSDPVAIVEVGAETSDLATGVAVQGDYAYVGAGGNTLNIMDISDPTGPFVVGSGWMSGSAWDVAVSGYYAYVANSNYGVRVFSVYDPTNPQQVGIFDTADQVQRLDVQDGLIFATDGQAGIWILEMDPPLGIEDDVLPSRVVLHPCKPNPFNPQTMLRFDLPASGPVHLRIFDLRGRQVATLIDEEVPAGRHEVIWNGRDASGRGVPSGVYLSRLEAGGRVVHGRMSLVR